MNIAILTPNQNPYSETFIQAHKNHLNGKIFYYYGTGVGMQLEGYGALVSNWKRLYLRLICKLLKKPSSYMRDRMLLNSFKRHRIEAVLVEYGTHAHALRAALLESGLPVVTHFHGYDASMTNVIERCNNYQEVFALSKKVIAVSKAMEATLLDLGCPEDQLVYNVYGPRPMFGAVTPSYDKKQFISIGRFTDKKAPYYTILAFKAVLDKHPDALLIMAGDGILLNSCKHLVKHFSIERSVHFVGVIESDVYCDYLKTSLAFVQHSVTADNGDMEGTPLAVLEASAAGLPVISTYHAGIPDVIIHEKTGLLCQEHDVATMTSHMLSVLDDVAYAKQLGMAGKVRVAECFSLERHIQVLQALLEAT